MTGMTVCLGPADRWLGGLAAVLGRSDAAKAHFESALALVERSGAPVWRADCQYEWTRALAAAGDGSAAAALASAALATASELGMAALVTRCEELLGSSHDATATGAAFPDGLSAREVDVLRLVASGCSNREIGEQLLISGNTASHHVRSILRKTCCANRAEASTYAARNDLLSD